MKNDFLVVKAHILNPQSDTRCDQFKYGAIVIRNQKIVDIDHYTKVKRKYKAYELQVIDYSGHVVIPGFFDMHFHWVQDLVREMPKANLLSWLEKYTFPTESKFASKAYARGEAQRFFKRLTSVGTLGGACFSSVHGHALEAAFNNALGDFIIGNVLMTMNSPKELCQSHKQAINSVSKYAKIYKKRYALTPRFAIATDPKTMELGTQLAKKHKSFIQSHLCETENEIRFVLDLYRHKNGFEKVKSYTEIYQKVGMLGKRTLMGHGVYLNQQELRILAKTDTAIVHCPTSNAPIRQKGLGSGLFNFKQAEKFKIRWALGSDIGGGPFLSMFDVIRSFVDQNAKAGKRGATYKKALYRATLAGAELLQIEKVSGNLDRGKFANFIVLPQMKDADVLPANDIISRYIDKGRKSRRKYDKLVEKVFYKGQLVFSR